MTTIDIYINRIKKFIKQLFCNHSYRDIIEREKERGRDVYIDNIIFIGTVYFANYICNERICVKCEKIKKL